MDEDYTPREEEQKTERAIVLPDFGQIELRMLLESLGNLVLDTPLRAYASPRPKPEFTKEEMLEMLPPLPPGPRNRKERRIQASRVRREK